MAPKKPKRFFGSHLSCAGGFVCSVRNARTLGINTFQVHPAAPQRWNSKPFPEGYETEFLEELKGSGIEQIFFHGIYLINLASPNENLRQMATLSLVHYLDLMARINGQGVIFHVGSLKDEPSEKIGYRRAADAINNIFDQSPGGAKLLLEVSAGGGSIIGDRLEELAEIYEMVEQKDRTGFALDTQHLWASGYDIKDNLEQVVAEIGSVLGFKKVWAIHVNDSLTELGSRRDRHANLGDGTIGYDALRRFVTHPKLARIPLMLETPALKTLDGTADEISSSVR